MKSGVAAGVDAAVELARDGGLSTGALIVAAGADEEHASLGADTFASMYRADAAVVTEPTGLRLATCQKGFEWVEVETFGRVAHGSRPAEGRDAILAMGRVLSRLDALNAELEGAKPHPTLGVASLHGSTIDGGRELSVYPDRCRLRLERRTLPGEPIDAGLDEVRTILESPEQVALGECQEQRAGERVEHASSVSGCARRCRDRVAGGEATGRSSGGRSGRARGSDRLRRRSPLGGPAAPSPAPPPLVHT